MRAAAGRCLSELKRKLSFRNKLYLFGGSLSGGIPPTEQDQEHSAVLYGADILLYYGWGSIVIMTALLKSGLSHSDNHICTLPPGGQSVLLIC